MVTSPHAFHIPVMGTGHSIDSPIRVAPYGIDSVISIVDDLLVERVRKHYAAEYGLPFTSIPRNAPDGRARRIAAYLDLVHAIVEQKFNDLKSATFEACEEKNKYFRMLPTEHPMRQLWLQMTETTDQSLRERLSAMLTDAMRPGSIDVNIMSKVDYLATDENLQPLSNEFSDASAALRGFANSVVASAVVLSAGFNPRLYNYLAEFPQFYRDATGDLRKRIVLKVSDFRSAMIQGRYLAKKGLEISEFRIESGLNCGGHAFYSDGRLMPDIMEEFRTKKDELVAQLRPMITAFYDKMGWTYPQKALAEVPRITVQGGIGNHGEMQRLTEYFGADATGWGTPFLVVPEATCVDDPTLQLLINAGESDLYLSGASPLGVPFNNLRRSGSDLWTRARQQTEKPGSPCPKGFLKTNTEFTDTPICTASTEYKVLKIAQIYATDTSEDAKTTQLNALAEKACLCDHLGNGSLIKLGIIKEKQGPQSICPGPNLAWFRGPYTLEAMVDHIYGRGESLVPAERPHVFAKELVMNLDYLENLMAIMDPDDPKTTKYLTGVVQNLEEGIAHCQRLAREAVAYAGENLSSLAEVADAQLERLHRLMDNQLATA